MRGLVVIDTTFWLFRSFHAIRDLRNRDGMPTNALYGLAGSLAALRESRPDAAVAAVMDAPGKTFRHEIYPEYKANRPEIDPALRAQIGPAKDMVMALGMQLYCVPGVEADDVIATLALMSVASGAETVVASPDKDLMYLAGRGCLMLDSKGNILGAAEVEKKFGVKPGQMTEFLILVGDSADNIKGVEGVGPKTAARLLAEHGNLNKIMAAAGSIKGKLGERLSEARPRFRKLRNLIELRENVDVEPLPSSLVVPVPDRQQLDSVCKRFGFGEQMKKRLRGKKSTAAPALAINILRSIEDVREALRELGKHREIGVHAETEGADAASLRIVGVGCSAGGYGCYLPVGHNVGAVMADVDTANANADVAGIFLGTLLSGGTGARMAVFKVKKLLHAARRHAAPPRNSCNDVRLLAFSLDSSSPDGLEALAREHLDFLVPGRNENIGARKRARNFAELELETAGDLACAWARTVLELRRKIGSALSLVHRKVYESIEFPVIKVLAEMEGNGVLLDTGRLADITVVLKAKMAELERKIADHSRASINLNSPSQLADLLYVKLNLASGRKTGGGAYSTAEDVLERLAAAGQSPVPRWVLEYRHAAKLSGTYTEALPARINRETGRLHTRYEQAGAVTGRLASAEPNLQNIPVRTETGREIRSCFIAPPGSALLSVDYSQIELRILAHFSGDKTLCDAFANDEDVHERTAAELFPETDGSAARGNRRLAKTINYGLVYGMGAHGLAQRLKISHKQSKDYIERYFAGMPGVRDYLDRACKEAMAGKPAKTFFGREIAVGSGRPPGRALRAAVNAPMQGTAADIMKLAMTAVHREIRSQKLKAKMLLQVHDELVFEAPAEEVGILRGILPGIMCSVAKLEVPLRVDVGVGGNWAEAH